MIKLIEAICSAWLSAPFGGIIENAVDQRRKSGGKPLASYVSLPINPVSASRPTRTSAVAKGCRRKESRPAARSLISERGEKHGYARQRKQNGAVGLRRAKCGRTQTAAMGILDFSEPGGLIGKAYAVYFRRVLPVIGRAICGPVSGDSSGAYSYLPASVGNFPAPPAMLAMMQGKGDEQCTWQPYTFGIAGLYIAVRPERVPVSGSV